MSTLAARLEKVTRALHRGLFRRTRGRIGGSVAGQTVLLLTTTGRRSGRAHTVPLMCLQVEDGTYLVAGSNAADPERTPAWVLNARSRAEVEMELPGGERRRVVADEVPEVEHGVLWARFTAAYPRFTGFQARTKRRIPLVRLRPVSST